MLKFLNDDIQTYVTKDLYVCPENPANPETVSALEGE